MHSFALAAQSNATNLKFAASPPPKVLTYRSCLVFLTFSQVYRRLIEELR